MQELYHLPGRVFFLPLWTQPSPLPGHSCCLQSSQLAGVHARQPGGREKENSLTHNFFSELSMKVKRVSISLVPRLVAHTQSLCTTHTLRKLSE